MAETPLVVVGHCTSTSARIFACTGRNRVKARIAWRAGGGAIASADLDLAEAKPYRIGVFELAGLPPGARVEYAVAAEPSAAALPAPAAMLAPGAAIRAFRLLPAGRPPRVALVSCNGWYQIAEEARRFAMWRRLRDEIAAGGVDLVIYAGDQIYADPIWMEHDSSAANDGLTPASHARVEALTASYRQWYFRTWSHRATADVLASCPSVMTWDDHDVYDGWGSNDDDTEPPQQAFFAAARRAFLEFQTLHAPPSIGDATSSAWGFVHAGLGILALDTRTNRMWKRSTVLGEAQHAAIETWLAANAPNLKHLVVVSSIPPVHASVSAALALMELSPVAPEPLDDLRDAWVAGNNRNELQRLMLRLFGAMKANPALRITIASGDVHVGTLARIESYLPVHARPDGSKPRIHQIVSSGIGHPPPSGIAATLMSFATGGEMELGGEEFRGRLLSFPDQGSYVLSRRNFATISFTDAAGAWLPHGNVRVAFHAEGEPEPIVRRLLGT